MTVKMAEQRFKRNLLRAGGTTMALLAAGFYVLWLVEPLHARKLLAVLAASVAGGRLASIAAGLVLEVPPLHVAFLLSVFSVAWLCIFYPFVLSSFRHLRSARFIGPILESSRQSAERGQASLSGLGVWSLPLFIWLPFPWTGGVAGATLGTLLGLPPREVFLIAIGAIPTGVFCWVFGFDYLKIVTGPAGKAVSLLIIGALVSYFFASKFRASRRRFAQ